VAILDDISRSLQDGRHEQVATLTQQAIDEGLGAAEILNGGLLAGMDVVGERFRVHEIFLPQVLLAARAMYAGMELLKPLLIAGEVPSRGKVVLGTVRGDLHDIGKNLVGIMLRGAGYEVIDLGRDVAPERFVEAAVEQQAPVIGMSALLTTTMTGMRDVVALLEQRGLRDRVKVLVGGAPVTADFARSIGADGYGFDASNAVERVRALVGAG
jgi:5-methyltetrahydrofolate--homocysteine methyltransferase